MIYTTETKKKLDAILKAFENYIDGQNYFDIVYSKKIGYVWIVVDEPGAAGAEQLDTPEAMLDLLFNDVIKRLPQSLEIILTGDFPERKIHYLDPIFQKLLEKNR